MGLSSYGTPFEKRYAKFIDGKIEIDFGLDLEKYRINNDNLIVLIALILRQLCKEI